MATPQFTIQSPQCVIINQSPGKMRVNSFDASGAPLNVSSGYTPKFFGIVPSGNANLDLGMQDIHSNMSFAFDSTGVTIDWTGAQAQTIQGNCQVLNYNYALTLSNDGGTTSSVVAAGSFQIQPFGFTV